MTQAVIVIEYTRMPGPLMFSSFLIHIGVFAAESESRFNPRAFNRHAYKPQMAKQTIPVTQNAVGFNIGRLNSIACAWASLIQPELSHFDTSLTCAHR